MEAKKEFITIEEQKDFTLKGTLYRAAQPKGILIYLHGGGLIFGERDDLPEAYIEVLTRDFDLLTADYRLAPESSLDDILEDIDAIYHYAKHIHPEVYVFGRSAGGYLALMTAKRHQVQGIIDFYGYHDFTHKDFKALPKNQQHVKNMLSDTLRTQLKRPFITTSENPTPRYLLYLYYRNNGHWLDAIHVHDAMDTKYHITKEELESFPPTFIVHAEQDPDVPSQYSETLARLIPENEFIIIPTDRHDFDQTVTPEHIELYQSAASYLTKHTKEQ